VWVETVAADQQPGIQLSLKRTLDLAGATVALVALAPLMALIACAIKIDSSGPVLFVQERAGKDGKPFRMYKFRSMVAEAEEMLDRLLDIESLPSPAFKIRDDPRVTGVGRVLRRTSLDELPQLWNVLRGEMSLVGPRPEEMRIARMYDEHERRRLAMKPGITGPMQIDGRGALTLEERMELELAYIDSFSLSEDLRILVKTLPAVLRGTGSY
jgi:lipopolysaccharide/colanic/teichoic acid biosynthesis glycosyltransferase